MPAEVLDQEAGTVNRISGHVSRNGDTPKDATAPVRLHLGSGNIHLSGFTNIDRKNGGEAYPLQHASDSVEEIVASHVLEHFSHKDVGAVLSNWVRVLKPGGKIRLAVPDFKKLNELYLEGAPVNIIGYVMGGHTDSDDRHGCLFDFDNLTELMTKCGLERIGPWVSDVPGCSQDELSLNLQGFKPTGPARTVKGVVGCGSTPRFGPLLHPKCIERASFALGVDFRTDQSCFWHQELSEKIESALEDPTCDYVLTFDFDTVFSPDDILELYRLMQARPDADAIFPLQSKRGCDNVLASLTAPDGRYRTSSSEEELNYNLLPANTGHFGLTMLRADSMRKFPRPWMVPEPNKEGRWSNGHTDADIDFWKRFRAAGFSCFLAPRIVVGHLEEVVKWPGKDLRPVYQDTRDYVEHGIPAEVER